MLLVRATVFVISIFLTMPLAHSQQNCDGVLETGLTPSVSYSKLEGFEANASSLLRSFVLREASLEKIELYNDGSAILKGYRWDGSPTSLEKDSHQAEEQRKIQELVQTTTAELLKIAEREGLLVIAESIRMFERYRSVATHEASTVLMKISDKGLTENAFRFFIDIQDLILDFNKPSNYDLVVADTVEILRNGKVKIYAHAVRYDSNDVIPGSEFSVIVPISEIKRIARKNDVLMSKINKAQKGQFIGFVDSYKL